MIVSEGWFTVQAHCPSSGGLAMLRRAKKPTAPGTYVWRIERRLKGHVLAVWEFPKYSPDVIRQYQVALDMTPSEAAQEKSQ